MIKCPFIMADQTLLFPHIQVGVNGYGFAINNNGFVVFHPGLNKKVWIPLSFCASSTFNCYIRLFLC